MGRRIIVRSRGGDGSQGSFTLQDTGGEYYAGFAGVQGDGEGEHVPDPLLAPAGKIEQPAVGAVDVGFAGFGHGLKYIAPVLGEVGHLLEHVAAGEPVAFVAEQAGAGLIHVLPGAFSVENLQHHVVSHGHVDA